MSNEAAPGLVADDTSYNDTVVRHFALMTIVWGIVGMLVGVILAAQLIWPDLTYGIPFLSYGRLRPLHTNAVIFAFGGSALFASSYYVADAPWLWYRNAPAAASGSQRQFPEQCARVQPGFCDQYAREGQRSWLSLVAAGVSDYRTICPAGRRRLPTGE